MYPAELIENAEQALSKSIMQLMRSKTQTYITCILLRLTKTFTNETEVARVNQLEIQLNPEFFLGLNDAQKRFLLVHEAWHVPFMDMLRAEGKDPKQWNIACDHYNNLMIDGQKDPLLQYIPGGCKDPKYTNWEKEDIYQDIQQGKSQDPENNPLADDLCKSDGEALMTPKEKETLAKQISSMVQQAAMQTKMMGAKVPEVIQEYLDKLYNPRLPWEKLLIKYMSTLTYEDYSYQRVNKAFFPHGILLPTLCGEGLGKIAIANDTSCSVSDSEFKAYLGALKDIKDRLNPEQIDVVNFTTRIEKSWVIREDEDISKIQFRAQGGTDLQPVFQHFCVAKNKPKVLIVFSDLECAPITQRPDFDVIWICVNNASAHVNFGKLIHITVKQHD